MMSEADFSKLKVNELKLELKKRGLNAEGKKSDLLERLMTHLGDSALLDDSQDDLLDDDGDLSDEVLDESAIDNSPSTPVKESPTKRPLEEEEKRHPKKIILNRKTIEDPDPEPEPVSAKEEISVPEKAKVDDPLEKCHILTPQQRLERRAARFGSAVTGAEATKPTEAAKTTQPKPLSATGNLEVLKKRAARFGTIAPALEKAKVEEKKQDRLKRFGEAAVSASIDDKKALRAARFAS